MYLGHYLLCFLFLNPPIHSLFLFLHGGGIWHQQVIQYLHPFLYWNI
ncbi:hypothetical protein FORC066_2474 [Yersinia enterocolitica]|nr:hypothetical protein FORC066_2474 [Yersinia enterocolitica]